MLTNIISVFCAFTGLLKFYHAVRSHLKWLRPFAKFMSIKGIVFLTFWQGLAIAILVNVNAEQKDNIGAVGDTHSRIMHSNNNHHHHILLSTNANTTTLNNTPPSMASSTGSTSSTTPQSPAERASDIQNFLICLEMLLFAIAHWCVFPAEEWVPGYEPKKYAKPGLAVKDFVQDVGHIVREHRNRNQYQHPDQQPHQPPMFRDSLDMDPPSVILTEYDDEEVDSRDHLSSRRPPTIHDVVGTEMTERSNNTRIV